MPFAAARQAAADSLLGEELSLLLSQPNNNLGVEYLRTLDSLNSKIQPMTVRREGAPTIACWRARTVPATSLPPSCGPIWSGGTGRHWSPISQRAGWRS